jgi:competence protein ComEC
MKNRRYIISKILCLMLVVLLLLTACTKENDEVFNISKDKGRLTARFFDISSGTDTKSGDSMLIKSPDGYTMLIDAGAPECAGQISEYLKKLNVTKIDYLVASHPHIDHIGGFKKIINDFEIGAIYMSQLEYPTETFKTTMKAIEDKELDIHYLKQGDTFKFGEQVDAKVYNPSVPIEYYDKYPEGSTQFVNDHSVVLKITYGEVSMLFMGDVYKQKEMELLEQYGDELQANLIKAGHHGSDTSSSKALIETVKPQIAIFTHDSMASLNTYNAYRKRNAIVYITGTDGNILVSTDGKTLKDLAERDRPNDFLD